MLNPDTVNSVRIYTILDKNNTPHVISAAVRVGGAGAEVDNFHAGGVGYPIDTETGIVCSAGYDILRNKYICHPATNVKVVGFEIPRWKELLEFVFSASKQILNEKLIAWDVAVLPDGFELIEGNVESDAGFMQMQNGKLSVVKRYAK